MPEATHLEPVDGAPDTFRIADTGGFASYGETVRIERTRSGD